MVERLQRVPLASLPALWFAIFVGPAAWTLHLLLSYPLVPVACATLGPWLLHGVTLVTVLAAGMGVVVALRGGQQIERGAVGSGGRDARRYLALLGLLMSAMFVFVILVEGLPPLFINPCGPLPWIQPAPL